MFFIRLKDRNIPKYVPPPQDAMPSKSILHKGSSFDQQNMTPMKAQQQQQGGAGTQPDRTEAGETNPGGALTQPMRRASMRPALPQNTLILPQNQPPIVPEDTVLPQNQPPITQPYSTQTNSPPSQSSPGGSPYSAQMILPQNQFPTVGSAASSMYQPQPYGGGGSQYGGQYGQYGQTQYPSSQNVDQYGNYGQGFQNQYQTSGYANQQVGAHAFRKVQRF